MPSPPHRPPRPSLTPSTILRFAPPSFVSRARAQVEFQREKLMASHVLLPLIELLRSDHDVLLLAVAKVLLPLPHPPQPALIYATGL